jgi:hypothetical protein
MGVPSRAARLQHAGKYCELWNAGRKDEWVASWRTLIQGDVTMYDPVGTKPKHGFQVCMLDAFDAFQPVTELHLVTVKVNGPEMAWVIDNHFRSGDHVIESLSIEVFRWDEQGDVVVKTYYDMPESVGDDDDPYELLLGKDAPGAGA